MGDVYTNPPQSRNEAILRATIDGTEYTAPPQSRIEDLLLELKEVIEQGGGAGDMSKDTYDPNDVVANAGGIAAYVDDEITDLHLGTASTKNSTSVVTQSTDLVESGAVYDALGFGNKNRFSIPSFRGLTNQGVTYDYDASIGVLSKSGTSSGTGGYNVGILNVPSGTYTFSADFSNETGASTQLILRDKSTDTNVVTLKSDTPTATATLNGEYYFRIATQAGATGGSVVDIQLEKGTVATAYEPYHESVAESLEEKVGWNDAEGYVSYNKLNYNEWKKVGIHNGSGIFENNGLTLTSTANDCYTEFNTTNFPSGAYVYVKKGDKIELTWDLDEVSSYGKVFIFPNGVTTGLVNAESTAKKLEYTVPEGVTFITFRLSVTTSGNTIHYKNLMIKKEGTPSAYIPYCKTNIQLTQDKADNSVIGTVEDGATASQAYAVGQHFIRDGAFCTVTSAISANESLVGSSKFTSGDVASALKYSEGDITPYTGFNVILSTKMLRKDGRVVNVSCEIRGSLEANTVTTVATIPAEFRPNVTVHGTIEINDGEQIGSVYISASGYVVFKCSSAVNDKYMGFNLTYINA